MRDRVWTLLAFAAGVLVFTSGLGGYGLWDPDEGRHSAIARELFSAATWRGWIVPSHNFADYHDKPILYYWLVSLAYAVAGVNERGARLVPVLSALTTLGAVFAWTATLWDARLARRAVLVLASTAGFIAIGRYGSLDMLLTCWLTLGLLAAERATARPERPAFAVAAGIAAGFGMLTKGLIAPLFIGGIALLHALLAGRHIPPLRSLALAALAFVVVAAPWYVAVGVVDPAYLREFFLVHHLKRFTAEGTSFHTSPWWYYAPALVLMFFPWSLLLPATAGATVSRRDPGVLFCWCWAATVLVFFSLSKGKLATYILPAMPPLAIATAHAIDVLAATHSRALRRLATGGIVVLAVGLAAAVPITLRADHGRWHAVIGHARPYLALLPLAAAATLVALWRGGIRWTWVAIVASVMTTVLAFYTRIAPSVSLVSGEYALAEAIAAQPTAPIVAYAVTPASLMFYANRPIVRLNRPRRLREAVEQQPFTWLVTSPRHVEEMGRAIHVYPWVTGGHHVLYATAPRGAAAAAPDGRPAD